MPKRLAIALTIGAVLFATPTADAAGPPQITESWVTGVTATGADLRAQIKPNGLSTTYRFEYVTEVAFQKSGFGEATRIPPSGAEPLGAGTPPPVVKHPNGLIPATEYRFRAVATNSAGTTIGPEHAFATQEASLSFGLPDSRAWELVSPPDKAGGAVAPPGSLFGGGELQAAADAAALTYSSASAFGDAKGAPPASQYISRRTPSGWVSENVSAPLDSAAYGDSPDGAPYRIFSGDLSAGLLFGGLPCRGGLPGCPAPSPVLPGTGAPAGFMAYYLRDSATGAFSSELSTADLTHTSVTPEAFAVSLAAASPDLSHVVLSSCAALTANATKVPAGPGQCNGGEQNLYERSGAGLSLVNLLPGETTGTPGARIAAPIGAVSGDGGRIYFNTLEDGYLYLREAGQTKWVSEIVGGGGDFQTASADGSVAFFSKAGHLYRYLAAPNTATDITPAGEVKGVLAVSADGSFVYYQDAAGLKLWHEGTTTTIAPGATASAPDNYPPQSGTARVSADGQHLLFLSKEELSGFDNAGRTEAYLYGPPPSGGEARLLCASCNPTGERPQSAASIPGVLLNGSTTAYKPRSLSANGNRVFFQSPDVLAVGDTNNRQDVYEWEAKGLGDCERAPGCVRLISSGRAPEGAAFADASADGSDVYFLTEESLLDADPGSIDLYDARVDGGIPEPARPIACIADACQSLPAPPDDPTPGTLTKNSGNPQLAYFGQKKKKTKHGKGKKGKGKTGKRPRGAGR